jgi:membrane-associated HD superfamily phosphohydrolase
MNYSPILSWATAAAELGLVLYVLVTRQRKRPDTWVLLGVLVLLAGYQVLEALNCSPAFYGRLSRAAFIDITWLPPVGLAYIALVMPRKSFRAIAALYIAAGTAFTVWYAFFDQSVIVSQCDTIIAFYTSPQPGQAMYGMYYQSGVGLLVLLPLFRKGLDLSAGARRSLTLFQSGVLAFMVPSIATVVVSFSELRRAMASIMCHYALLLGLFIGVLLILEQRDSLKDTANRGAAT